MGVPGFFKWLLKNYKKEQFVFNKNSISGVVLNEINKIDYLLIDANCLIHPMCYKVLAENPDLHDNEKLELKMFNTIIEYIEKIITYVNPIEGIFLAVDGVAPIAKIKQQRSRRFKKVSDVELDNNLRRKYSLPIPNNWNSSAITPGTIFMENLHNKLISWAKSTEHKIIYSSCFTPGEGEHKLLQFIRNNQSDKNDYSYVIYGLDADLIFLALATNSNRIYLLREAIEINNKECSKEIFNYVSIKIMRNSIVSTVMSYLDKKSCIDLNETSIVNDFIFMCYFLGNDFLPHIPSLDISHNGIETLIKAYVKTFEYNQSYLLTNKKERFNIPFLIDFIKNLANEEPSILREHFVRKPKSYKCDGTPYEKEKFKIDNLQFKIKDPILLGSDTPEEWSSRYYKYYFGSDTEELKEQVVINYLIGIKWVTLYYFDKCPAWNWYFQYDHPPFLSDIAKYLNKFNFNKYKFKINKPLKPFMQLLSVLPQQSGNLLPKVLNNLMTEKSSKIIHLYPLKFELDFINKRLYWMANPILPPLDIDLILTEYLKLEPKLKKTDVRRNKNKKNFFINI